MGLAGALDKQDVVLLPPFIMMDTVRAAVDIATVAQQPTQSQIPIMLLVPSGEFSFSELSLPPISLC